MSDPRYNLTRDGRCSALVAASLALLVSTQPVAASAGPRLLAPTQGRPQFIEPGGSFRVGLLLDSGAPRVRFELVDRRTPESRVPLPSRDVTGDADTVTRRFSLIVPQETPERTYDLRASTLGGTALARHAVAVRRLGERVRLVHLSNMNVGDVGAPDFDWDLVEAVNLVAPTLIIATGDFLDATHPNRDAGYEDVAEYLASFDAPVLTACGDHDDLEAYAEFLAPSPIGTVDVGRYQALVLYDTPRSPVVDDEAQIAWIEEELQRRQPLLRFAVSHDDCPNLLAYWQQQGTLSRMLRRGRLGLWFTGGHRDWDGREYRSLIEAAAPMLYVRTHQASTTTREDATGVSHFRIIDLEGERVVLYGAPTDTGIAASIPVGRLNVSREGAPDGTRDTQRFTAISTLPFRVNHLRARVLLAGERETKPWCRGGRLVQAVHHDTRNIWECEVEFDLPDKSALCAQVGTSAPPPARELDVHFDVARELPVAPGDRAGHVAQASSAALVHIRNRGSERLAVEPVVRLDGETVPYRVLNEPGPVATAYRLRLVPGKAISLRLDLSGVRVRPGRRELQVYLKGGQELVPICWPLEVVERSADAGA